jgi:hypothetical protein
MKSILPFLFLLSCTELPYKRRDNLGYSYKQNYGDKANELSPIKKKVALLNFFNEAPHGGEDLAITATEELRRNIGRIPDLIIDTTASKIFGDSKEVYAQGGVNLVELKRKAKIAGVNLVIFGRISEVRVRQKVDDVGFIRNTKSYAEVTTEVRVFDINNGKEVYIDKRSGSADDSTFRFYISREEDNLAYKRAMLRHGAKVSVRKFIPQIAEVVAKMDWVGRVAKIIGAKIYINAGRNSGIQMGDVLKVITEGREVYDPETGALLGVSNGEVKGTVEVIDYFGPDGAVTILHSGGSVTEGDFIELY